MDITPDLWRSPTHSFFLRLPQDEACHVSWVGTESVAKDREARYQDAISILIEWDQNVWNAVEML